MLGRAQVSHEDLSYSHRVLPILGHVDRGLEVILNFEFAGLRRDDLDDGHLADEFFRLLAGEDATFEVPTCSLKVETLEVAPVLGFFLGEVWIAILCDHCIQSRLVEGPSFYSAGGLHERSEIGFGDVQSR